MPSVYSVYNCSVLPSPPSPPPPRLRFPPPPGKVCPCAAPPSLPEPTLFMLRTLEPHSVYETLNPKPMSAKVAPKASYVTDSFQKLVLPPCYKQQALCHGVGGLGTRAAGRTAPSTRCPIPGSRVTFRSIALTLDPSPPALAMPVTLRRS